MPPARWGFYGDSVFRAVAARGPEVEEDFKILLYELSKDPTSSALGVERSRDDHTRLDIPGLQRYAGSYIVPLRGHGILEFEILADYPRMIHLNHIAFFKPPPREEPQEDG